MISDDDVQKVCLWLRQNGHPELAEQVARAFELRRDAYGWAPAKSPSAEGMRNAYDPETGTTRLTQARKDEWI